MKREEAESLLIHEVVDGAFVDARLGKDAGPDRMARLLTALKVLWLYYHTHIALPFTVASPASLIVFYWPNAVQAIQKSGTNYRENLVAHELPGLGIAAFELLSGPDAAPVIPNGLRLDANDEMS